ncbi:MAG: (2Fe-2S)-binding protein [Hyphomicrobiaceae bacterium]|nr:(2Fe-2S)-binding protein [Hyphomicrobiaceae bacterium]
MAIALKINGKSLDFDGDPETPLLWVIRETQGLTGTKYGCGKALCGACTIHLDGEAVRSCQIQARDGEGRDITTIEGLQTPEGLAVQTAWIKHDVAQCGFCQSGQIMAATGLLMQIPDPTDSDIDNAMQGNICRCCTYHRIRAAIHDAAALLKEKAG